MKEPLTQFGTPPTKLGTPPPPPPPALDTLDDDERSGLGEVSCDCAAWGTVGAPDDTLSMLESRRSDSGGRCEGREGEAAAAEDGRCPLPLEDWPSRSCRRSCCTARRSAPPRVASSRPEMDGSGRPCAAADCACACASLRASRPLPLGERIRSGLRLRCNGGDSSPNAFGGDEPALTCVRRAGGPEGREDVEWRSACFESLWTRKAGGAASVGVDACPNCRQCGDGSSFCDSGEPS